MLQAFNLTIPGIPCIYYGDEYGSIGGNDPDNRKMMNFDLDTNEKRLKQQVEGLVKARRNSMALQYGSTKVLRADAAILIIKRQYFNEVATIIFNKSLKPFVFENSTIPPNNFKLILTE